MATLEIIINGQAMHITAEQTEAGGTITVKTDKGEWKDTPYLDCDDVETNDDLARMLFTALAAPGEAERYPTYRQWCKYMTEMGDTFTKRVPEKYVQWTQEAEAWNRISSVSVNDTLDYLNDNFDI